MEVYCSKGANKHHVMNEPSQLQFIAAKESIKERRWLKYFIAELPAEILYLLLEAALHQKSVLAFNDLISFWPLENFILRGSRVFGSQYAIVLASVLQRRGRCKIKQVDMSGSHIGEEGTTAFAKLGLDEPLPNGNTPISGVKMKESFNLVRLPARLISLGIAKCFPGLGVQDYGNHLMSAIESAPNQGSKTNNATTCQIIKVVLHMEVTPSNYDLVKKSLEKDNSILEMRSLTAKSIGYKRISALLKIAREQGNYVEELDLSMNSLGEIGTICVCREIQQFTKLKKLNLAYNNIGSDNDEALGNLKHCLSQLSELQSLNLTANRLEWGFPSVIRSIKSSSLVELNLSCCKIHEDNIDAVRSLPSVEKFLKLDLSYNNLRKSFRSFKALLEITMSNLEELNLETTGIKSTHMTEMCLLFREARRLRQINIGGNHLTTESKEELVSALPNGVTILMDDTLDDLG